MARQGFDKKTSQLFTPKDFMSTYTTCYDMCTQRSPYNWSEQLYDRHGDTISQVCWCVVLCSVVLCCAAFATLLFVFALPCCASGVLS